MLLRATTAALACGLAATNAVAQEAGALQHEEITVTTSEGLELSAFVSRPTGETSALPAIYFTQWVVCGSIAPNPERPSMQELLALAANVALIRVDRSGSGKSEGAGCDKLDYDTEVRHYREAFDQLIEHPWVDRNKVVVVGSSLGSTTAPLVAVDRDVAGVVIQGAGALTYYERMVHFDRLQLERQTDFSPLQVNREMRRRMEFQDLYLHRKMTPSQIAEQYPHLEGVWESLRGTSNAPHYGRPFAWHWQAAEQDWLGAWSLVEAPIMVVFGEYEQFESRHGHRVIVDTVNRLRPGSATWLEIPKAGHSLRIYPDQYAAFDRRDGKRQPELYLEPVAAWLRSILTR